METSTQEEPSREGRKRTMEAKMLLHDVRENVGSPSNLHRQRRSNDWYNGYMALMSKSVDIEPYSFEEVVQQPNMG